VSAKPFIAATECIGVGLEPLARGRLDRFQKHLPCRDAGRDRPGNGFHEMVSTIDVDQHRVDAPHAVTITAVAAPIQDAR
jgi:hypothetical protein